MTYTKITGKFIGECMTGFGISYPVKIYNYGNSEVLYTIASDDSNFSSSVSSLTVPNGSQGLFDVYFDATINGISGYESGIFTITSESTEDGSIDPSGDIYLYITGHRIVDTTGGHVRNFRAVKNYDVDKGLSYDFYWLNPTGTGNLYNYFITGYKLEISTNNSFGAVVASKFITVPRNTSLNPRYGSYDGLDTEEQNINITTYDDLTPFTLDTDYYARIYSITDNGVTGASVFATGINAYNEPVSQEVVTGNVNTKINIEFTKKTLDIYLPESLQEINYNLYNTIVENNNGSNNLKYTSGINIYFQDNTSLFGGSETSYPLNLEGEFLNFTGHATYGTNINLYLHETTKIYGKFGNGGDIDGIFDPTSQNPKYNNPNEYINNTLSKYSSSTNCKPATNGGSIFNFKITTNVNSQNYKDLNYNIFSKYGSVIAAGGAGTDASIGFVDNFGGATDYRTFIGYGNDKNRTYFKAYFSLGGNSNLLPNGITSLDLYESITTIDSNGIKPNIASPSAGKYSSYPSVYGEDNSSYKVPYFKPSVYTNFNWYNIIGKNIAYAQYIPGFEYFTSKAQAGNACTFWYRPIKQNISEYTIAGKIVDSFTESKINFNFNNDDLPSDFVFRFANNGINSSTKQWTNTSSVATLAGSTDSSIFNNSLYSFLGKNSITLSSNEYLQCNFSSITSLSTQNCQNFDLFLVVAYRPVKIEADSKYIVSNKLAGINQYNYSKFKILDWFDNSNPNNITEDQILINNFPGIKTAFSVGGQQGISSVLLSPDLLYYPKEPNMFQFFINPLVNGKVLNRVNEDSDYAPDPRYELWKMIVQIDPNLAPATNVAQNNALNNYTFLLNNPIQVSRSLLNATDYYPMIMNIRRTGSTMTIFVNGISVISYNLNNFIADANNHIIRNLSNSTLKLISKCDDVVGGNKESMSYFDIIFYNRNLATSELNSLHTNLIKEYFKLFSGSSSDLNIKSNRIRLPNIFNLTGRSN